jgi:ubiquinone/menaquinone biosynthesis C-methylase UbiE
VQKPPMILYDDFKDYKTIPIAVLSIVFFYRSIVTEEVEHMSKEKNFWNREAMRFSKSGNQESIKLVQRSIPYINADDRLLDFACGTGQSTLLFSDTAKEAIGLDYSEEMIEYAKLNENPKVSFYCGSFNHPILQAESFDVIVAFNVLHLVKDLDKIQGMFYQALKPGGYFISYTPCLSNTKSLWVRLIELLSKLNLFPQVFPLRSKELIQQLKNKHFTLIHESREGQKIQNLFLVLRKEL